MPTLAIALLLTSAALHALWNLLLKQSREKYLAMGWQVIIGSIVSIIALFLLDYRHVHYWYFFLISTILEAIYFGILTYAYNDHDFSLVYPVARGAAPALVVIWTALFLDEIPSTGGLIGIILIVCGLVIIGATSLLQNHSGKPHFRGIAIALSVALVISIYTLVDGYAVRQGPALSYGLSLFILMPVFTTPFIVRHYGMEHTHKSFPGTTRSTHFCWNFGSNCISFSSFCLFNSSGKLFRSHPGGECCDGCICRMVFFRRANGENPHPWSRGDICWDRHDRCFWLR